MDKGSVLAPFRFVKSNSRLVDSKGFDSKTTGELTRLLLAVLSRDFGLTCCPGVNLVRAPRMAKQAKGAVKKLILIGASNLKRLAQELTGAGYGVEFISIQGGVPSDTAIAQLKTELLSLKDTDIALVFDLFGNYSYRFIQADGSLALPIMMGGKYHLLGDMAIVQDSVFKGLIPKIIELLGIHKDCPQVIFPPIPRYICGSCCDDINHGNNCRDPVRAAELGGKIGSLRKILKEGLVKSTLDRFWVPDIMGGSWAIRKLRRGGWMVYLQRTTFTSVHLGQLNWGKLFWMG